MSASPDASVRPRIDLSGGDLHRKVDQAWHALVTANDPAQPRVLVRGNELVRMTERGELEVWNVDSLRDELSRAASFGVVDGDGDWIERDPPADVAKVLLNRDSADYVYAPRIERVVDTPVLAANGSIVATPGYHESSRLYFIPSSVLEDARGVEVEMVPDDVEAARELLVNDLLGDFPFEDQASRANALGLLLLPFVRDFIGDSPTPMHVILAPQPGTGKTLLAEAALIPSCGLVPAMADSTSEEETRKRITATLMRGARAIVFDNVARALSSSTLAAALTSNLWRDRVLGYSKEVALPIRNAWVATGNNLDLTDEHARRAVPIYLDPGEVRPADRPKTEFRHPDLKTWALANRAELATAALTLIQHWLNGETQLIDGYLVPTGEPPMKSRATLGSFERWADVIGGILGAAGVDGFLDNLDRLRTEADPEKLEALEFLEAWHKRVPEPVKLEQLVSMCQIGGTLYGVLPAALTDYVSNDAKLRANLGVWLRSRKNARIGNYQLIGNKPEGARVALWHVRHRAAPSTPDGAA